MAKNLVHSFYYILYQPKGVPTSRNNFFGTGGTFLFLNDRIYSYTKKAIWHLAIWQNWCFGHIFRALISSEKNLPLSFHRITIWQFDKEGVNESHSKLHKTWSLCNIILLFWPAYIWRIFLEKKNANGCFVFRWQCAEFFFSKIIRQMKAGQNNKYDITDSRSCAGLVSHVISKVQLIWKCPFDVFKLTKKTNEIFVKIFALASKKRPNQKNKGTLYH